jgi:hypothetical protein
MLHQLLPINMSRNYKFHNLDGVYFISFAVVEWLDVFSCNDYVHNNPVEAGLVFRAEDYLYSSAADYAGEKGLLDNVLVIR